MKAVMIAVLFGLMTAAGFAATIAIVNPGFEDVQAPNGSAYYTFSPGWGGAATLYTSTGVSVSSISAPGWGLTSSSSGIIYNWATLPAASGHNSAWVTGWAEQTLADSFQTDMLYTLSAKVGWRTDEAQPGPDIGLYWMNGPTYTPVAPLTSSTPAVVLGGWATWTKSYLLGAADPALGKPIVILANTSTSQAAFDDFSLDAVVPEPAALALLGLGSLTLLRRHRSRPSAIPA